MLTTGRSRTKSGLSAAQSHAAVPLV